jgi:hypothetical protein
MPDNRGQQTVERGDIENAFIVAVDYRILVNTIEQEASRRSSSLSLKGSERSVISAIRQTCIPMPGRPPAKFLVANSPNR